MEPSEPVGAPDMIVKLEDSGELMVNEHQGGEHVFVLEVPGHPEQEDGTLVLNINGQAGQGYFLVQNEDGSQYFVLVNDECQPTEQALANVIHTDFEEKPIDTLLEPNLELGVVSPEVSNACCDVQAEQIEKVGCEPLNFVQSKTAEVGHYSSSDSLMITNAEPEFKENSLAEISSPQALAHLESKHPNLMQLACVAESLESETIMRDKQVVSGRDSPRAETQTSVIVSQNTVKELDAPFASSGEQDSFAINNAVSVIHSAVSEDQVSFESSVCKEESSLGLGENINHSSVDEEALNVVHPDHIDDSAVLEKTPNFEDLKASSLTTECKEDSSVVMEEKLSEDVFKETAAEESKESEIDVLMPIIHSEKTSDNFTVSQFEKSQDVDFKKKITCIHDDDSQGNVTNNIVNDPQENPDVSQVSTINETCKTAQNETAPEKNLSLDDEKVNEYNFSETESENVDGFHSGPSPPIGSIRYSFYSSRRSKVKTLFSTLSSDSPVDRDELSQRQSPTKLKSLGHRSPPDGIAIHVPEKELGAQIPEEDLIKDSDSRKMASSAITQDDSVQNLDKCASVEPLAAESMSGITELEERLSESKCDENQNMNVINDSIFVHDPPQEITDSVEEPLVKPPKNTYDRRKANSEACNNIQTASIELFSDCTPILSEIDKELREAETSINMDKQECARNSRPEAKASPSTSADSSLITKNDSPMDDMLIVGMKVTATYDRKRKASSNQKLSSNVKSLRTRSSAKKPHINGFEESSVTNAKCSNDDLSNSEHIAWGDVLLKTQFQSSGSTINTQSMSARKVSSKKKESPSKKKQLSDKLDKKFDSLFSSSFGKSNNFKKKNMSVIQKAKKVKSKYDGSVKGVTAKALKKTLKAKVRSNRLGRGVPSKPIESRSPKKKAEVSFSVRPKNSLYQKRELKETTFYCHTCDFSSTLVDNLIEHLKYCTKSPSPIDFSVDDMDKRQRIRGEDLESFRSEGFSHGLAEALGKGEYSGSSVNHIPESDDEETRMCSMKNKYGYGKDDIVWVKVDNRFWPGLVCELNVKNAFVKLINYPKEKKGLKINAERVHTFDDAKWNKMLLGKAAGLPDNEIFVKAVQTSETFVRKKWLGLSIKGKEFFVLPDEIEFTSDNEHSDNDMNEDSDCDPDLGMEPSQMSRDEKIDAEEVKNYILSGVLDDYVLSIYHGKKDSERHKMFVQKGKTDARLTQKSCFGPCEKLMFEGQLVNHFKELFLKHFDFRHFSLSYICEVWIPEAIIKAISFFKKIPLEGAEELFETEDCSDQEDPSLEDIRKMYSSSC